MLPLPLLLFENRRVLVVEVRLDTQGTSVCKLLLTSVGGRRGGFAGIKGLGRRINSVRTGIDRRGLGGSLELLQASL